VSVILTQPGSSVLGAVTRASTEAAARTLSVPWTDPLARNGKCGVKRFEMSQITFPIRTSAGRSSTVEALTNIGSVHCHLGKVTCITPVIGAGVDPTSLFSGFKIDRPGLKGRANLSYWLPRRPLPNSPLLSSDSLSSSLLAPASPRHTFEPQRTRPKGRQSPALAQAAFRYSDR
jgi:hypothetical protein